MPRKNKPSNLLTFRMNADPEMLQNAKSEEKGEKSDTKYPAIHFLFFTLRAHFSVFRDKFIALMVYEVDTE